MLKPDDNIKRTRKTISLNEAIEQYLGTLSPKATGHGFKLQQAWEKIALPQVRAHTDSVVFDKRGKGEKTDAQPVAILVYVKDSSWAAELSMQREFYRLRMEQELGRPVSEVRFLVSRIAALRKE